MATYIPDTTITKDIVEEARRTVIGIERRFGVEYHERSVSRLLHELGFSHMSARPLHPKQDAEVVDAYKKSLPPSRERAGCRTARGNRVRDMAAG